MTPLSSRKDSDFDSVSCSSHLEEGKEKTDLLWRNCLRDEKMGSTHNHLFVNKTPCTTSESQLVDEVVSGNF